MEREKGELGLCPCPHRNDNTLIVRMRRDLLLQPYPRCLPPSSHESPADPEVLPSLVRCSLPTRDSVARHLLVPRGFQPRKGETCGGSRRRSLQRKAKSGTQGYIPVDFCTHQLCAHPYIEAGRTCPLLCKAKKKTTGVHWHLEHRY